MNPYRKLRHWISERRSWNRRIHDAVVCPDNSRLARVANAGQVEGEFQIMHNGLRVLANGYYGNGITRMLKANRGCHEPQEEAVFCELLKILRPGSVIVEGGAYWAFYSMWFLKDVPSSRAFLIEPDPPNIEVGKRNLAENRLTASLTNAYVGKQAGRHEDGTPVVCVDDFARQHKLDKIDVLHMDIQGAELDMLTGARHHLTERLIDYIFISTHSESLHADCAERLRSHGYRVLTSVAPRQSFSYDGLLVAQSPDAPALEFAPVSLKA